MLLCKKKQWKLGLKRAVRPDCLRSVFFVCVVMFVREDPDLNGACYQKDRRELIQKVDANP